MERVMSVQERIRRAEAIYEKRKQGENRPITKVSINNQKKDVKLLKKMIIQILICMTIYFGIYMIYNNKYVFSEDFIKKANEILSYDTNFKEIYESVKNQIQSWISIINNDEKIQEEDNNNGQEGIGGAEEKIETENTVENQVTEISQEEKDIQDVKNTTTFIKPVEGVISSQYGRRDTATSSVPKNHTGTDIAAVTGTKIKSSTEGEVVLVSEEGDYGKHLKVQIGEVSIIYAHCNQIYVKQGEKVVQGQEIAEVGSTGNSTGPHLHFEIRISERTVNPQSILEL